MPDAQDYRFWFDCEADAYFVFHFYSLHCLVLPSFRWKRKREYHYEVGHMIVTKKTIININNMWIIAMSLWWRMISLLLSPYQLYFRYFYCQLIFSDLRKNKPLRCLSSFVCVFLHQQHICARERFWHLWGKECHEICSHQEVLRSSLARTRCHVNEHRYRQVIKLYMHVMH